MNGRPWPDTLALSISLDSAGTKLPNRSVALSLEAVDSAGASIDSVYGHFHRAQPGIHKPVGRLSATTVNTGSNGVARVLFRAGTVAGPVVLRAQSTGAREASDTIHVGVFGLVPLVQRATDTLIGATSRHPVNHYGIGATVDRLNVLADSVYARYRRRLFYNDLSLRFGGRFDRDTNWAGPHDEHRTGRDADVRTDGFGGLTPRQRQFVRRTWLILGGTVHDETVNPDSTPNTINPHYYLRYRGRE